MSEPRCREQIFKIVMSKYASLILCMTSEMVDPFSRLFVQLLCSGSRALDAVTQQHALTIMLFTLKTLLLVATSTTAGGREALDFKSPLMVGRLSLRHPADLLAWTRILPYVIYRISMAPPVILFQGRIEPLFKESMPSVY